MKKIMFTVAALFVLAGSTVAVATPNAEAQTKKATAKPATSTASTIPPPSCPMNDPNGCGIFD